MNENSQNGPSRSGQCVEVAVRVRPFLPKEMLSGTNGVNGSTVGSVAIDKEYNAIQVTSASTTASFCFDHVLGPECTQDQMFARVLQPKVFTFLNGFNTTVIGYGQTASGKSHTIGSGLTNQSEAHWGLIPRMLHEIFRKIEADKLDAQLHVSFLEIYGEDIHDLLLPITNTKTSRTPLNLRQDRSGVFVQGIREVPITSAHAALEQLRIGCMARITGSTEMNDSSSRSHAVYTLTLVQKTQRTQPDDATFVDTVTTISKFTFVDLAGSERLKKTMAEGTRMKEGIQINVGLLALGNVINALGEDDQSDPKKKSGDGTAKFVPYRSSKLTRLLQDALGGNSRTLFMSNVDPRSAEVSNLHAYVSILQRELVRSKYLENPSDDTKLNALLADPTIQQFLKALKGQGQDAPLSSTPPDNRPAPNNNNENEDDDDENPMDVTRIPACLCILELGLEKEAAVADLARCERELHVERQTLELKRRRERARRDTLEQHVVALKFDLAQYDTWQHELASWHDQKLKHPEDQTVHDEWKRAHDRLQPLKKVYAVWKYTTDRLDEAKVTVDAVQQSMEQLEDKLNNQRQVTAHVVDTKDKEIEHVRKYPQSATKWSHNRLHMEDTEAMLMQALRKRASVLKKLLQKGPLGDNDKLELHAIDESIQTLSDTLKRLASSLLSSQPEMEALTGDEAAAVIQDLVMFLQESKRMELCAVVAKQQTPSVSCCQGGSTNVSATTSTVLATEELESQLHALKLHHEQEMIDQLKTRQDNHDGVYAALEASEAQ
ncbi:hypothetical protein DYB35_006079, partial [Aphanomyces astaci]